MDFRCKNCGILNEEINGLCEFCGWVTETWPIKNNEMPSDTLKKQGYLINKQNRKITPYKIKEFRVSDKLVRVSYPLVTKEVLEIATKEGKMQEAVEKDQKGEPLTDDERKNIYENIARKKLKVEEEKAEKYYEYLRSRLDLIKYYNIQERYKKFTVLQKRLRYPYYFYKHSKTRELDIKKIEEFFETLDLESKIELKEKGRRQYYDPISFIKFFIFEGFTDYRSRKALIKDLKENKKLVEILGFKDEENLPTLRSFSNFERNKLEQIIGILIFHIAEIFWRFERIWIE